MRVARVSVRAPVTSFRHPFFVTGRQPTSLMPPPATIHGHCASALGSWPDPSTFFFGIHFTFRSRAQDLEHQHITKPLGAKAKTLVPTPDGPERATTEVTVQPVLRDFLFDVAMTLYLPVALAAAFRAPVHTVVLGRSQDLAEIERVDEVELVRPVKARLEHTLLPFSARPSVRFGSTVLLARHVTPPPERLATFDRYVVLHDWIHMGPGADRNRAFIETPGVSLEDLWADPAFVDESGFARGVWFHRITDRD